MLYGIFLEIFNTSVLNKEKKPCYQISETNFSNCTKTAQKKNATARKCFGLKTKANFTAHFITSITDIIYDDVPSLDDIKEAIDVLMEMNNPERHNSDNLL